MLRDLLKQVKIKNPELVEPSVIKYEDSGTYRYLTLNKEAANFIYSNLGLKPSISKKLFNLDQDIWRELIDNRFANSDGKPFSLSNYNYIVNGSAVVALTDLDLTSQMDRFGDFCDTVGAEFFVNNSGELQIHANTSIDESTDSIVLIDMDIVNGVYRMFSGIRRNGKIILIVKPIIETWNFSEFMFNVDIENEISMSAKMANNMNDLYDDEIADKMLLSVREVLDFIKYSKCDVELDDEGFVSKIEGMDRNSSAVLSNFVNSFKLPYKSLKKLGYLRKSLRYDSVTLDAMLDILSFEYFNMNSVDASVIVELLKIYDSMESDRNVLQAEIRK